ncbi:beta strand repeat-containing protein [Zhongshania marina]|nr:Calx-beta domain-containing protein [Marortus luteolus]
MKEFDKKDVVINDVDGDAVDALSADLADVVANQTDSVEEVQLSLSKKEKELDDSKQADAKESVDVAAADSGLADMIMAESQSTATSGQGGGAASADGGLSSNGKLLAVAGVVTAAGIAVAASDGDGGGSGKNNQEFTVSIDSPSVLEGNSGSKELNFTVTLDEAPKSAVTFNYSITAGTATADDDFEVESGTITFQAGQLTQNVSVTVLGDTDFEANETVILTVTGEQAGAAVQGTGTITNDDADPAAIDYDLSVVNTPSVVEGNNGTVTLRYELSLDRAPTENVTVNFQTLTSGTATAGADFVAQTGSVTFLAGQTTSAFVDIVVNGDTLAEGDETINVLFSSPQLSAPVTSTGTIQDDESANTFFLTTGIDNASAEIFNSQPEYTPGGDDLVNTLQDEDVLTGTGAYNVLNATIGSISEEGTESEIAPTLINIQEVNLNINDDDVSRIDFQDADDVTNLNIVRMTDTGASITLDNLAAGTDEVGIESATSQGTINLLYREDELTALDNTLALDVGQAGVVRLSMLNIAETGDSGEDQGFGFETVNMTTDSLTNIDNVFIAPNANEDRDNDTDQSFNLDANAETEINNLVANGVEFMTISADGDVMIAADEDLVLLPSNDGIATAELQMLTIDGSANVTIDGLDGDIDNDTTGAAGDSADDTTLVVDAAAMTGDLTLGVLTGADGESADANYEDRADKDLSVTSGSGDDTIKVYSNLAGDITTNDGNDTVAIGDAGLATYNAAYNAALAGILVPTPAEIEAAKAAGLAARNAPGAGVVDFDLEGVSTIDTGAGDDTVVAGDMGVTDTDADEDGNDGYDDVTAAKIITGDGNDSVSVGNLTNGQDWDNFDLNDANADDLYNIKAASISTGAGDDTVAFDMAAENAVIDTGADADTVNVQLEGQTVLEGDTNANYTMLNQTSAGAIAGQTKEVKADGTADLLGAQLLLGEGNDVANFDETDEDRDTIESQFFNATLIVGQDALLDGGAGNDVMNVTALDFVQVNTTTTADDGNTAAEEFNWDVDANITGIETANLTIANQIDNATALAVGDAKLQNDDWELDGVIIADVMRFDTALTTINLDSQEVRMRQSAATEIWEAGQATEFDLFNFREDIALTLKANEASGVTGGLRVDDTTTDVFLYVDVDGARDHDDVFALDIQAGSESFDLSLMMGSTTTDTVGDAASTTDDDDMLVENVVINLNDSASHAINMNNFGDAGHSDDYIEGSLAVETSLTINDSKDGTAIVVTNVNADTITGMGAADFNITVDAANNYEITTGSGDDVINMIADDVRADDNVDDGSDADAIDATDEADYVDGGAGTDRLVVSGDDTLGTSNAPISGNTDDDVFEGLVSLEQLEINNDTGALQSNGVVLDEAAQDKTNLQEIYLTGNGAQNTNLTIGENFENDLIIDASTKDDGVAGVAGAATNLIIESQDSDSDTDLVNLDVKVNLQDGVGIDFENTGDNSADVAITATVSELAAGGTSIYEGDGAGDGEGTFDLRVQQGVVAGQVSEIDTITLVDTDASGVIDAVALNGEQDNDSINVVVSDNWSESKFTFDASAIENNDQDADGDGTVTTAEYDASILTGGLTYNAGLETDATHTVLGTANNDMITGSSQVDTVTTFAGDDTIITMAGDDVINSGADDDTIFAGAGADTIDAGTGNDQITGGLGVDTITTGTGKDNVIINAVAESTESRADVITDFETGKDTVTINADQTNGGIVIANGSTVNLGRFASVGSIGAGDNSLDGTAGVPVLLDAYYASGDQLAIDVDGDGDITDINDVVITSANSIAAGDVNYNVNIAGGNNHVRLGQGVDKITTGAGDDVFTIVGSLTAADVAGYNANVLGAGVVGASAPVLQYNDLLSVRSGSEANAGDVIDAGAGNDNLHLFGTVDMTAPNVLADVVLIGVETVTIHSSVTMSQSQVLSVGQIVLSGDTAHNITIVADDGSALTYAQQLAIIAAMPQPISVTGSDVNTSVTIGGTTLVPAGSLAAGGVDDGAAALTVNTEVNNVGAAIQPNAPTAPDLAASDDSGALNNDDITNVTTDLDFSGITAQANQTVTVFDDIDNDGVYDLGENAVVVTSGAGGAYSVQLDLAEGNHNIRAFVTDSSGIRSDMSAPTTVTVIDTSSPVAPTVALNSDTGTVGDGLTSDNVVNVTGLEATATWQYSLDNGTTWVAGVGSSFNMANDTSYAAGQIQVRQTDVSGNVSPVGSNGIAWTEDSSAPAAPTLALNSDSGANNADGITNDNVINVAGLEGTATWEYSLDGGANWTAGVGSSFNMASDTAYAAGQIQVRQTDAAGNLSAVGNNGAPWTEDSSAPAAPALSLNTDSGANNADGITNDNLINVAGLEAGATWEYSLDGGTTWIAGVGAGFNMASDTAYAAGQIQVRQTDLAGNLSGAGSNAIAWTEDSTVAAPTIALDNDTGVSNVDGITSDNEVNVTGLEAGGTWEFSLDNGVTWVAGVGTSFNLADNTNYAAGGVQVRQTDVAGNLSATSANGIAWSEDSLAPAPLTFALNTDSGANGADGITNDNVINVGGLEGGASTWEYSLDGGATWQAGVGSTINMADDTVYAVGQIQARQTDVAGNQGAIGSNAAAFTEDSTAPIAPTLSLNSDTGPADGVTSDNVINVAGLEGTATWQYSLDSGTTWQAGVGTSFNMADDTAYAAGNIQVQQTDLAGNVSAAGSNAVAWTEDSTNPAAPTLTLNTDTGSSNADGITTDNQVNVAGLEANATWQFSLDNGATWSAGAGSSFNMADDTAYAAGNIQVQQTDEAGNTSAVGSNAAAWTEDSTAPVAPAAFASADAATDTFIIDFVEDLGTASASLIDLYVNGALVGVTSATVNGAGNLEVVSAFDFVATDVLDVAFDVGAVTDVAGNMLQAVALGDNPAQFVVV